MNEQEPNIRLIEHLFESIKHEEQRTNQLARPVRISPEIAIDFGWHKSPVTGTPPDANGLNKPHALPTIFILSQTELRTPQMM